MIYEVFFEFSDSVMNPYSQIVETYDEIKAKEIAIKQMNDDLSDVRLPWIASYGNIVKVVVLNNN